MDYKKEMIQMIKEIENDKIIKMLYNFVKSFYKEERGCEKTRLSFFTSPFLCLKYTTIYSILESEITTI